MGVKNASHYDYNTTYPHKKDLLLHVQRLFEMKDYQSTIYINLFVTSTNSNN